MNEKRIQQVLDIEKQAQEIHESAVREAGQLPITAEQKGQALIEKSRSEAQEEAKKLVARAQAESESARILAETQEKNQKTEALAMNNFDRAVAYVIERVIGKE
jgi:hypothetical protein